MDDISLFMNERNAALGLEADGSDAEDRGRRRTNAFHEYIPIEEATIKPDDLEGVIQMGGIDAQAVPEPGTSSMFAKFKNDVKISGARNKKGDSELMEFGGDASAEDAVGEMKKEFGLDEEEDAALDLVANLGSQVQRTSLAAMRR